MTTRAAAAPAPRPIGSKAFAAALLANALWINASEIFRYFVFVMPMMRAALPDAPNVAPMDLNVFLVWGVWDAILLSAVTLGAWICLDRFGDSLGAAIAAGGALWAAIFGLLWLGLFNMNLATPAILAVALPLSLLELVVAAVIVQQARARFA